MAEWFTLPSPALYPAIAAIGSILVLFILNRPSKNLRSIPTVSPTGILTSWIGCYSFIINSKNILFSSARRFPPGSMYRIRRTPGWQVIVSDLGHVADIKKARDSDLSLVVAQDELLCLSGSFGREIRFSELALKLNQRLLSPRSIELMAADIYDEMLFQIPKAFPTSDFENGWKKVCCFEASFALIAPVINRFVAGKDICRNPEYHKMLRFISFNATGIGMLISLFPKSVQPLAMKILSPYIQIAPWAKKIMGSYIQQRLELFENRAPDEERNLFIDWIIEAYEPAQRNVDSVATAVSKTNLAGLMSNSLLVTSVIFQLATFSQHVPMLREEIEKVTREHGWTKTAVSKMEKVDSFIAEVSRLKTTGVSLTRKVVNPHGFTFSDGTTLPFGTYIGAANFTIEHSPELHDNPEEFDPLRNYRMRKKLDNLNSTKYLASTPDASNLLFGLGVHACPGRMFSTFVTKLVVARIVSMYDFKIEENKKPEDCWRSGFCLPDMSAPILYRKRQ